MGIEHLNSLGRNEPCWCQSGTKYKKCHLDADEAAHRASLVQASAASATATAGTSAPAAPQAPANQAINRTLVLSVLLAGLAALVLVTVLRDFGDGLIAGLAVILVGTGYAILRDPPPVHRDKAESTPTTFNINPPSEASTTTSTTRMVRGMTPPAPRTRRKPR